MPKYFFIIKIKTKEAQIQILNSISFKNHMYFILISSVVSELEFFVNYYPQIIRSARHSDSPCCTIFRAANG